MWRNAVRRAVVAAGLLINVVPVAASASEPTNLLELDDVARAWEIGLDLRGIEAADVVASLSFNRFAGRVVGRDERLIGERAVTRGVELLGDAQAGFRVNVSPVRAGEAPLPNGIYSTYLVLDVVPGGRLLPQTIRHPIYFRVTNGAASRIDMLTYSEAVEPTFQARDKTRALVPMQTGVLASRGVAPRGNGAERLIESGDRYAIPGNEADEP